MIEDGEFEGLAEMWWEDGTPASRMKLKRGVMVDTAIFWSQDGRISQVGIYEDGISIFTENWHGNGILKFQSVRVSDSTYRTIRWDESGMKIKDTLEVYPKKRIKMQAPIILGR